MPADHGVTLQSLALDCATTRRKLVELTDTIWGLDLGINSIQSDDNPDLDIQQKIHLARAITDHQRATLQESVLFVADESMTELVNQAAQSLPEQALLPDDALVPEGFVLFARPIPVPDPNPEATRFPITALQWSYYDDPDKGPSFIVMTHVHRDNFHETNFDQPMPDHLPFNFTQWPTRETLPPTGDVTAITAIKVLATFWTLARQKELAETDDQTNSRTERKLSARRGIQRPEEPVRLVRLSTAHTAPSPEPLAPDATPSDEQKRQYHHQWIVRGFWRQTWFASLGTHRAQWIAPHRRGPKDKPLLGAEKVIVVQGPPAQNT